MRKDECQTQSKTGEMMTVRGWQGAGKQGPVYRVGGRETDRMAVYEYCV